MRVHPDQQCSWPGFQTSYDRIYDPKAVKAETERLLAAARLERGVSMTAAQYAGAQHSLKYERIASAHAWRVGERVYMTPLPRKGAIAFGRVVAMHPLRVRFVRLVDRHYRYFEAIVEPRMLRRRGNR